MSKVQLSGNASGTGIFTIASPNSNVDRTVTLPDATGTVQVSGNPISGTTGTFSGIIQANGGGVQFPATQVPSSNANTLDDYEEGTWTPLLNGVSMGTARYIKIGQLLFCEVAVYNLNVSSIGATTNLSITGLPFSVTVYQYVMPCAQQSGVNYGIYDAASTTLPLGVGGTAVDFQPITRNTLGGGGNISFRFSFTLRADT